MVGMPGCLLGRTGVAMLQAGTERPMARCGLEFRELGSSMHTYCPVTKQV